MLNDGAINNNLTRGNKTEIVNWGTPNYSAGVQKDQTTGSSFSSNVSGIVRVWLKGSINCEIHETNASGQILCGIYGGGSIGSTCFFPIDANKTYYVKEGYSSTSALTITFFPYK